MKICSHLFFLLLFLIGICQPKAFAQLNVGVHLNVAQPIGDYADNVFGIPAGISLNLLVPNKKWKGFYWGGEIGVGMFRKDQYILSKPDQSGFFEVDEEDCYLTYHLTARYMLMNRSIVTPYVEGKIGGVSYFSTLFTEDADEVNFENETRFHGTPLNVGFGGRALFRIAQRISVDANVILSKGSKTNYRSMDDRSDQVKQDLDEGKRISDTDHFNFKLGILFGF